MFTGLVQQVGRLERISFQGDAGRLELSARFDAPLQIGESVAVNGACLTLVEQRGETLVFDVLRETFDKTALRDKVPGAPLNLERGRSAWAIRWAATSSAATWTAPATCAASKRPAATRCWPWPRRP
jgi:riboflavin synthase alpha subunit